MQREKPLLTGKAANQHLRRRNNRIIVLTALAIILAMLVGLLTGGWPEKTHTISIGDDIFSQLKLLKQAGIACDLSENKLTIAYQPSSSLSNETTRFQASSYNLYFSDGLVKRITWQTAHGEILQDQLDSITIRLPNKE